MRFHALLLRYAAALATPWMLALTTPSIAAEASGSPASLRAAFAALQSQPEKNPFGIPLYLASSQTSKTLKGDLHARVEHPFATVRAALQDPRSWCEILILHPNVKGCRQGPTVSGDAKLTVLLGSMQHEVEFDYRVATAQADYLDVGLDAPAGPAGTTDYRIRIEATPLDGESTLLHLAYSHGYGARAKLAMQTYFNTLGRNKVGFTVVERTPDGKPVYVRDLRGGLERNAMRYYVAIRSHLDALAAPPAQRLEKGLRTFLAWTERYPLQLKEESGYAEAKRRDFQRVEVAS